jgi:hypothetical protein
MARNCRKALAQRRHAEIDEGVLQGTTAQPAPPAVRTVASRGVASGSIASGAILRAWMFMLRLGH